MSDDLIKNFKEGDLLYGFGYSRESAISRSNGFFKKHLLKTADVLNNSTVLSDILSYRYNMDTPVKLKGKNDFFDLLAYTKQSYKFYIEEIAKKDFSNNDELIDLMNNIFYKEVERESSYLPNPVNAKIKHLSELAGEIKSWIKHDPTLSVKTLKNTVQQCLVEILDYITKFEEYSVYLNSIKRGVLWTSQDELEPYGDGGGYGHRVWKVIRSCCKFAIRYTIAKNRQIHYFLDGTDEDVFIKFFKREGYAKKSWQAKTRAVTQVEFLYIYKHWDKFHKNVIFYRNNNIVNPPWFEANIKVEANKYKTYREEKYKDEKYIGRSRETWKKDFKSSSLNALNIIKDHKLLNIENNLVYLNGLLFSGIFDNVKFYRGLPYNGKLGDITYKYGIDILKHYKLSLTDTYTGYYGGIIWLYGECVTLVDASSITPKSLCALYQSNHYKKLSKSEQIQISKNIFEENGIFSPNVYDHIFDSSYLSKVLPRSDIRNIPVRDINENSLNTRNTVKFDNRIFSYSSDSEGILFIHKPHDSTAFIYNEIIANKYDKVIFLVGADSVKSTTISELKNTLGIIELSDILKLILFTALSSPSKYITIYPYGDEDLQNSLYILYDKEFPESHIETFRISKANTAMFKQYDINQKNGKNKESMIDRYIKDNDFYYNKIKMEEQSKLMMIDCMSNIRDLSSNGGYFGSTNSEVLEGWINSISTNCYENTTNAITTLVSIIEISSINYFSNENMLELATALMMQTSSKVSNLDIPSNDKNNFMRISNDFEKIVMKEGKCASIWSRRAKNMII